jgi:hypothetical protein
VLVIVIVIVIVPFSRAAVDDYDHAHDYEGGREDGADGLSIRDRFQFEPPARTAGLEPLSWVPHPSTALRTGSGWSLRASARAVGACGKSNCSYYFRESPLQCPRNSFAARSRPNACVFGYDLHVGCGWRVRLRLISHQIGARPFGTHRRDHPNRRLCTPGNDAMLSATRRALESLRKIRDH